MKDLKYYQKIKEKIKYNFKYQTSALKNDLSSVLGTIEKDASGFFWKT